MQTKLSAAQIEQLKAIDTRDREFAFELGFAKVAEDRGLTDAQYKELYEAGVAHLAKLAQAPKA